MRILVIPTTDWRRHPVPGRLNFIFDRIAKSEDVHVVSLGVGKFASGTPRNTTCQLHEVALLPGRNLAWEYMARLPTHATELSLILREVQPDCIVSSNILPSTIIGLIHRRTPIIVDYLDHFEESAGIYYPPGFERQIVTAVTHRLMTWNVRHCEQVITVTLGLARVLSMMTTKPVHIIPNGVDLSVLRPTSSTRIREQLGLASPVLGYVGSLEPWIDLETVIRSLPMLADTFPGITLLVVGPGLHTDYASSLASLAATLGVSQRIFFTGAVPYEDLSDYISAMDIGLNPRKPLTMNAYSAGGKVFNYLACGKRVLSSPVSSLEELFGSNDGIRFYGDASSFVDLVRATLGSPSDSNALRNTVLEYDWSKLAKKYLAVLRNAVG